LFHCQIVKKAKAKTEEKALHVGLSYLMLQALRSATSTFSTLSTIDPPPTFNLKLSNLQLRCNYSGLCLHCAFFGFLVRWSLDGLPVRSFSIFNPLKHPARGLPLQGPGADRERTPVEFRIVELFNC